VTFYYYHIFTFLSRLTFCVHCHKYLLLTFLPLQLPFHIQWQDLKDLFRAAGAVARADVTVGPDGRSRGFGTVSFVTEDGAERARRMFDGCVAAFFITYDVPSAFMCTSLSRSHFEQNNLRYVVTGVP
jgi:RNA recognition motif-containing protein